MASIFSKIRTFFRYQKARWRARSIPGSTLSKVCPNCKKTWYDEGAFCKFCGARKNQPDFIVEKLTFAVVYGPPPVAHEYTCTKCGYSWTTEMMFNDQDRCPRCGSSAPAEE